MTKRYNLSTFSMSVILTCRSLCEILSVVYKEKINRLHREINKDDLL
jgi:hypothetical protein